MYFFAVTEILRAGRSSPNYALLQVAARPPCTRFPLLSRPPSRGPRPRFGGSGLLEAAVATATRYGRQAVARPDPCSPRLLPRPRRHHPPTANTPTL